MTSAARAEGTPEGVSIGAVLRELQSDFPDLTISKIRYLETEGLISPERRASGYRLFAPADVARLRFILTAQRERFWPLRVIKDALDRLDQGLDVPGLTDGAAPDDGAGGQQRHRTDDAGRPDPRPRTDGSVPEGRTSGRADAEGERAAPPVADLSAAALRRRRAVRLTPLELRERTGLDRGAYGHLLAFGLLRTDASGRHHADDLDVATAAASLARYGLEARHLRAFRVGADREIGLAAQILEPLRRRRARGAEGPDPAQAEAELLSTMLALHVALVRSGLARGR